MRPEQIADALNRAEVNVRDGTIRMSVQFRDALVKRLTQAEPEIEGSAWSWWYVCPDCHGQIDKDDGFCRHCGREIRWT